MRQAPKGSWPPNARHYRKHSTGLGSRRHISDRRRWVLRKPSGKQGLQHGEARVGVHIARKPAGIVGPEKLHQRKRRSPIEPERIADVLSIALMGGHRPEHNGIAVDDPGDGVAQRKAFATPDPLAAEVED